MHGGRPHLERHQLSRHPACCVHTDGSTRHCCPLLGCGAAALLCVAHVRAMPPHHTHVRAVHRPAVLLHWPPAVCGMPGHTAVPGLNCIAWVVPTMHRMAASTVVMRRACSYANSANTLQVAMCMEAASPGAPPAQRAPCVLRARRWFHTPLLPPAGLWCCCIVVCGTRTCNATTPHPCACCAQTGCPAPLASSSVWHARAHSRAWPQLHCVGGAHHAPHGC